MKKKLTHNLGLKILAVLFAAGLWVISININDPISPRTYSINVQLVNLKELTDAGKYVEVLEDTDNIRVTVRASRSVLASFNEKNLVATADLSEMTDDNLIPIALTTTKTDEKIESIKADKEYVKVSIENVTRLQKSITVVAQNEPAEGYILRQTTTDQNAVIISGPDSLVSRVATARVEINVDGATSDVNISLPLRLYDEEGRVINDNRLSKSVTNVSTTATIFQLKDVELAYNVTGEVAEGYVYTKEVKSNPSIVTVAGKPGALKNIDKIDISNAIDIEGATGDVSVELDLNDYLPEGIILANSEVSTIKATAVVEKEELRIMEINLNSIELKNVPENLDVKLKGEDTLEIRIAGKKSVLDALTAEAIVAYVDVEALMQAEEVEELSPGHYYPKIVFDLPDFLRIQEPLNAHIVVE